MILIYLGLVRSPFLKKIQDHPPLYLAFDSNKYFCQTQKLFYYKYTGIYMSNPRRKKGWVEKKLSCSPSHIIPSFAR
jgi:hypothetical protein